jgi:hypothetical protein
VEEVMPASPSPIESTPSLPSEEVVSAGEAPPVEAVSPSEIAVPSNATQLVDSVPVAFEGTFEEDEFGSHPMILTIERFQDTTFRGQLHWPSFGTVTAVVGELVETFDESVQWNYVDGFDAAGGIGLLFTETDYVSGDGILIGGWYYGFFQADGTMRGVASPDRDSTDIQGSFQLIYTS